MFFYNNIFNLLIKNYINQKDIYQKIEILNRDILIKNLKLFKNSGSSTNSVGGSNLILN